MEHNLQDNILIVPSNIFKKKKFIRHGHFFRWVHVGLKTKYMTISSTMFKRLNFFRWVHVGLKTKYMTISSTMFKRLKLGFPQK